MFKYFTSTYLAKKDIHSLTCTFDTDTCKTVLSVYFLAVATLKAREIDASIPKQESALLAAALSKKASVFALFGGQGTNEVYFDELQNLYDIYKPFMAPFIRTLTKDVLVPLVAEEEASTKALFGLVTSLRKVRAQSGLDQSKTPFSQRKPVFSIRFLLVGVPYHSEYLDGVTDMVAEDLEDELWEVKDLKISDYNTKDGISVLYPIYAHIG